MSAGTRGPLDFVEFPSHLMEYFSWHEAVLPKFGKHVLTGTIQESWRCVQRAVVAVGE